MGRKFRTFLLRRAWTGAEGPVALFNQAVGWLRRNRVLLPGVSVPAKQVGAVRRVAGEAAVRRRLAAAQARGWGRRAPTPAHRGPGRARSAALRRPRETVQQVADLFGVDRSTVYGHLDKTKTVPRRPKKTAVTRS